MEALQEKILMINQTTFILWGMHLLKELLYTGIHTSPLLYTDPIIFGLMNINIVSP